MDFNFHDQSEEDPYMELSESDSGHTDEAEVNFMELLNYNAFKLVNKPAQGHNNQSFKSEQLQEAGSSLITDSLELGDRESKKDSDNRIYDDKEVIDLVSSDGEERSETKNDHPDFDLSALKTNGSNEEETGEIEWQLTEIEATGLKVTQSDVERLRGVGKRYFITERNILCFLCNQKGHEKFDCQYSDKCSMCGELGHTRNKCPELPCRNCKKKGHSFERCSEKKIFNLCFLCDSHAHNDEHCSHVWRQYNIMELPKVKDTIIKFCYNCAGKHFGDDCPGLGGLQTSAFRELDDTFALSLVKPIEIVEHRVAPGESSHAYFNTVIPGSRKISKNQMGDGSGGKYGRGVAQAHGRFSRTSAHSHGHRNSHHSNPFSQTSRQNKHQGLNNHRPPTQINTRHSRQNDGYKNQHQVQNHANINQRLGRNHVNINQRLGKNLGNNDQRQSQNHGSNHHQNIKKNKQNLRYGTYNNRIPQGGNFNGNTITLHHPKSPKPFQQGRYNGNS